MQYRKHLGLRRVLRPDALPQGKSFFQGVRFSVQTASLSSQPYRSELCVVSAAPQTQKHICRVSAQHCKGEGIHSPAMP